jgi:hypothetical protein
MLQLEWLSIDSDVHYSIPHDVESQLLKTPNMTQVTLANLRWFVFHGVSAYLDGLVTQISAPSLSIFRVYLFDQLSFPIPRILQFMQSSENLIFSAIKLAFYEDMILLHADTRRGVPLLELRFNCRHLASAVQFLGTFSPVLSVAEQVTLSHSLFSSQWPNIVNRTQWRDLLRLFNNARALYVQEELVGRISRSLQSVGGGDEPPLELLPNLQEVGCSGRSDAREAFTAFLDERQVAGHPVSLRMVDPSNFVDR